MHNFPPPPILELTFEQEFELAKMMKVAEQSDVHQVRQALAASLRQNYLLRSTVTNLLLHWPTDANLALEGDTNAPKPTGSSESL